MNLFAQLAQQTLGEMPALIMPWLAARFENAGVEVPFTPVADEERGVAVEEHGIAVEEHGVAVEEHGVAVEERGPAEGLQPRAPVLQPLVVAERAQGEAPHAAASFVLEHVNMLRLPTIEPLPARRVEPPATAAIAPALPQPLERAAEAAQEAVPAIHVSIGRVEVRAVMRPQEPPRRERATPRPNGQSLDEYLRKGRRER
jgi:hypothetical protein